MVGRTFSSSKGTIHKARPKLAVRKRQIAVFYGFSEKLKFFNSASALRGNKSSTLSYNGVRTTKYVLTKSKISWDL